MSQSVASPSTAKQSSAKQNTANQSTPNQSTANQSTASQTTPNQSTASQSTAERNRQVAIGLSNNFARLLREFSRDFERRIFIALAARGYTDLRPAHSSVFANLGLGAVRVTELAERAQVTQQAMGKMLKEVERLGYIARDVDRGDKRAKEIRLTERGIQLTIDCLEVVDELMAYYEARIGRRDFVTLQGQIRDAVGKLELHYMPECWTAHDRE